jgi:hypothetical protein
MKTNNSAEFNKSKPIYQLHSHVTVLGQLCKKMLLQLGNVEYFLMDPPVKVLHEKQHDEQDKYQELHAYSKEKMEQNNIPEDKVLNSEHIKQVNKLLPDSECQQLLDDMQKNPKSLNESAWLERLLPQLFSDELNDSIRSYFNSEYSVFWYTFHTLDDSMGADDVSARWHCDGGPTNHLKLILYLNDSKEHQANTQYLEKDATDALKNAGYIFGDIYDRQENITPLLDYLDVSSRPQQFEMQTGDAVIFNPFKVAHRGKPAARGKKRYSLHLCILPSPFPWQEMYKNYYPPKSGCQSFSIVTTEFIDKYCQPLVHIDSQAVIRNESQLLFWLNTIFNNNETYTNRLSKQILQNDPNFQKISSLDMLIKLLKSSYKESINWQANMGADNIQRVLELALFEDSAESTKNLYLPYGKPKPSGIFWPDPTHPKYPSTKYGTEPFVQSHKIMSKNTPIGSAGSCFAFEIAKVLQQENFNYVVTERADDPKAGIIVDGYNAGDQYAKFSANYGILFNTPSFKQLAEKAFRIKEFTKYSVLDRTNHHVDPYRENVYFQTQKALLDDYPKHIEAVRQSLLQCEVFIVTLGLNECWQFRDGSVISRNPREGLYTLLQHKILTVQENVDNIQCFFDIVKQHNPNFKLIISLSPIPFLATGRAVTNHVITANCHSKAVLRVAADELVANNEDMYYLPSYELVTECSEAPWGADLRHVTPETVQRVITMFKHMFVKSD